MQRSAREKSPQDGEFLEKPRGGLLVLPEEGEMVVERGMELCLTSARVAPSPYRTCNVGTM
jgi:hypothetical protein